jgi:carboxylate-amine ligase
MIDFGLRSGNTRSINKLLEFVDDVVDELGSREHINYVHQILKTELERQNN